MRRAENVLLNFQHCDRMLSNKFIQLLLNNDTFLFQAEFNSGEVEIKSLFQCWLESVAEMPLISSAHRVWKAKHCYRVIKM